MAESGIRILGIDPGTRHVGYGILEQRDRTLTWVASGCISGGEGEIASRLVRIHRGLAEVIERHHPDAAAVETVFTSNNPKTAIAIGEGRGVAVLSAAERGLTVTGYEPTLVKRAVAGSGRAGKEQVRSMVQILLSLPEAPATDHEADALALAITHAMHCRAPSSGNEGRKAARPPGSGRGQLPEFVLRQLPPDILRQAAGRTRRAGRGGRRA